MAINLSRSTAPRAFSAIACLLVSFAAASFSFAQFVVASDPELAHKLAPYDGRITARLSAVILEGGVTRRVKARSDSLAKRALRSEPTAVLAVSTLGLSAEAEGDKDRARRYFAYAKALSRRDFRTQFWEIEDSVQRGDVRGTLREYDSTLRVFPDASPILYPVLGAAIVDPPIRAELERTLARQPNWGNSFTSFLASNGSAPQAAALLLSGLVRRGIPLPRSTGAGLIASLLKAGRIPDAWRYYTLIRGDVDASRSRDPNFLADLSVPTAFDWTPVNESGTTATLEKGGFSFEAPSGTGGPVLQQVELLLPGRYRLRASVAGISQPEQERPYWLLRCANGVEAAKLELSSASGKVDRYDGLVDVRSTCFPQTLLFVIRPTMAVSGVFGQLKKAEIVPAG